MKKVTMIKGQGVKKSNKKFVFVDKKPIKEKERRKVTKVTNHGISVVEARAC